MRIISLLAAAVLPALLLPSCGEKKSEVDGPVEAPYELVGPLALEIAQSGGSQQYSISTDGSWQVVRRSAQVWAEARPVSGTGDGTFLIYVSENTTGQKRSMRFSIYIDGEEQSNAIVLTQDASETIWDETGQDADMVSRPHVGVAAFDADNVLYRRNGKAVLDVSLSAPVVVAVADQEEAWGFFQFPGIASEGNTIYVGWQMNEDTEISTSSGRPSGKMYSTDGGATWHSDGSVFAGGVELANGDRLNDNTQAPKDVTQYTMPSPVGTDNTGTESGYTFYEWDKLPEDFQGWYLTRGSRSTRTWSPFKASVFDPGACVHATGKWMRVALWGSMILMPDGSLVAGVYGVHYAENGVILNGGTTYYRSTNEGLTWTIQGKIPFGIDYQLDPNAKSRSAYPYGFSEPETVLLSNGKLLHVVRTGGPLYRHLSEDAGKTWSKGVPFTPNGVKPHLLQLGNGVTVLSTGRPGVQVRFSFDGDGEVWTDPFDMLSYPSSAGNYDTSITCGYAPIIACGNNSFYIVYSDFKYQTASGEIRKAIKFRKITVNRVQ